MAALAIAAVPVLATQPQAHAQASSGVPFAIDNVTPRYAQANSVVTVTGTLTNNTGTALTGLTVQLYSAGVPFSTRDYLQGYLNGNASDAPGPAAEGDPVTVTVRPGATVTWHAEFTEAAGQAFGVYPLQAVLENTAGTIVGTDRTLLPYWPGSAAGISKLKISWIWPLIDQPQSQVCPALTSNELASSVTPQGRLGTLLAAGGGAQGASADLTWAIDPALLDNVSTMEKPYQVGGSAADCTGTTAEPASTSASTWLNGVSTATSGTSVILTPYANVDMAALVHQGMAPDLAAAYQLGDKVAQNVLHRTFWTDVALPPGGLADQEVLTALAAKDKMTSVVLGSGEMPPQGSGFTPDDAVTSVRTMAGEGLTVMLADDTITSLLKEASGNLSPAARFAVEQEFLAQTAMIASEVPDSDRSVVISPPETWAPSLSLASDLLNETTSTPWLQPAALSSLSSTHVNSWQANRSNPPLKQDSPKELSTRYLGQVSTTENKLNVFQSMLYQPTLAYTGSLSKAVAATESSAWRNGDAGGGGSRLRSGLSAYLSGAQRKVQIIKSPVQMAGSSGELPVSIQNGLEQQAVEVRLSTSVREVAGLPDPLTISPEKPIIIQAGQTVVLKLSIHNALQGSHEIYLNLTSANGTPLGIGSKVSVNSTRFGQAILILIAAAIGLLLLTSVFRSKRRRLAGDASGDSAGNVIGDPAGRPVGHSGEPEEAGAPDDLADARRGADDS
jgi:hypothetical protein